MDKIGVKLTVCNVGRTKELNERCGPSLYVSRKSNVKKRASACLAAAAVEVHRKTACTIKADVLV